VAEWASALAAWRLHKRQPRLDVTALPPSWFFVEKIPNNLHWVCLDHIEKFEAPVRPVAKSNRWRVEETTIRDSANVEWRRDVTSALSRSRSGVE
jgi:hypothetical protein